VEALDFRANAVSPVKPEHVSVLERTIAAIHGAEPIFRSTTHVRETFRGETIWDGPVYTFDLAGHPTAVRCYGLACRVEGSEEVEFITVLGESGVVSPQAAVRVFVAPRLKNRPATK